MTTFQLLMLGASAYFAFKIYEHIQTLQEPQSQTNDTKHENDEHTFSPFNAQTLIDKADIAFDENDFQKALALLIEADNKEKDNSEVLFKIGYILQQTNDNDEALKYYKKAIELDKENEFIHNSIASIYRANQEFTSAKIHLKDSLAIDDSNPITYYNYGNLLVDMAQYDEAMQMYEKAIELNPEFSEAKAELDKLKER